MARQVDYDEVAPCYDKRYERYAYEGVERAVLALGGAVGTEVLEVGCGTGFWLGLLQAHGARVTGLDASAGMLEKARGRAPEAVLVHGRAERLPFEEARFDRVLCANAFHHFEDKGAFLREARRVLRPLGALMVVGLDPHTDREDWFVYDYFAGTRQSDRERYPESRELCRFISEAGFVRCRSALAHAIDIEKDGREALADGSLGKQTTSQLAMLSDAEYRAGIAAIEQAAAAAEARHKRLLLRAKLELHACWGFVD
jgi:ubiquinone/menaquinone biosynthesis C-methylase UbiE